MNETIAVTRNDATGQYEITVDGALAGYARFRDADGVRTFPSTVVDPAFSGRGLGGTLVNHALDETEAAGLAVDPACSFVAKIYAGRKADS